MSGRFFRLSSMALLALIALAAPVLAKPNASAVSSSESAVASLLRSSHSGMLSQLGGVPEYCWGHDRGCGDCGDYGWDYPSRGWGHGYYPYWGYSPYWSYYPYWNYWPSWSYYYPYWWSYWPNYYSWWAGWWPYSYAGYPSSYYWWQYPWWSNPASTYFWW